jgi:proline dehydrogenase
VSIIRRLLLGASGNTWLRERATRTPFVMRSVARFMPGERLDDAIDAARREQTHGIHAILTHLGENLTTAAEADEVTRHYLQVLDRVDAAGLDAQISIKPTQLGLDLDPELCYRNLQRLLDRSSERQRVLWMARVTSTPRWRSFAGRGSGRRSSASRCRRTSIAPSETSTRCCRSA